MSCATRAIGVVSAELLLILLVDQVQRQVTSALIVETDTVLLLKAALVWVINHHTLLVGVVAGSALEDVERERVFVLLDQTAAPDTA